MQEVKMSGESLNIEQENISKLKEIFPEVFNEDKIDFDKLQNVLGNYIDTDEEKYRFTWNGKMNALRLSQTPSSGALRPCKNDSKEWDTTQNIYIEGDNLEVLKLLQNSYLNKIKMVYIDPPYNTGNDFVYKDDFKDNIVNYKKITGQIDSEGNITSTNNDTDGRYHTNWLNMMYPRLRLARNLLTNDGIIFISIDDNELVNLTKIADEIFGKDNYIGIMPRITKKSGKQHSDGIAKNHDYLLLYAKSKENLKINGVAYDDSGFNNEDEYVDERGKYKLNQTLDYDSLWYNPTMDFPIEIDGVKYYPGGSVEKHHLRHQGEHNPKDWVWRWSQAKFDFGYRNGFVVIKQGKDRPRIYTKTYLNASIEKNEKGEYYVKTAKRENVVSSIAYVDNMFSNDNAKKELAEIIDPNYFDFPKPVTLLENLIKLVDTENMIILDFFSGSGTTAHAVMNLNKDGKKRKFIAVQLQEQTELNGKAYKDGYKTICDIAKQRLAWAGEQIIKDIKDETLLSKIDVGFKVFKLDSSNIKKWNPDTKDLGQSLLDQINNFVEGRTEEDALYEIILKNGLPLTVPVEELDIKGKKVYSIGMGALIVCLDNEITLEVADEIAKISTEFEDKNQVTVVFKDNGFANDSVKTNIKETIRGYGIGKFVTV